VILICVSEQFSAAHSLPEHPKCGLTHGHNYTVVVKVKVYSDMNDFNEKIVVDFADIKKKLKSILNKLDHMNLNDVLKYPTAENIAKYIRWKLSMEGIDIAEVKVHETDKYWVELRP